MTMSITLPKIKLLQHKRQSPIIRLHTALKERLKNTNNLHRHKANLLKQMQHPAINRLNIWITTTPESTDQEYYYDDDQSNYYSDYDYEARLNGFTELISDSVITILITLDFIPPLITDQDSRFLMAGAGHQLIFPSAIAGGHDILTIIIIPGVGIHGTRGDIIPITVLIGIRPIGTAPMDMATGMDIGMVTSAVQQVITQNIKIIIMAQEIQEAAVSLEIPNHAHQGFHLTMK